MMSLLRGFRGHPSHPPLTDVSIGAYTVGVIMIVAGLLGWKEEAMADAAYISIGIGLIASIATIITGFADYVLISKGTPLRRAANAHWIAMSAANALFLVAVFLLTKGFEKGYVPIDAAVVALAGFAVLMIGGWLGGSLTYVYGMRVVGEQETPLGEAAKPHVDS